MLTNSIDGRHSAAPYNMFFIRKSVLVIRITILSTYASSSYGLVMIHVALTGVDEWVKHHHVKPKVASLIPCQGTRLGCRLGPLLGVC